MQHFCDLGEWNIREIREKRRIQTRQQRGKGPEIRPNANRAGDATSCRGEGHARRRRRGRGVHGVVIIRTVLFHHYFCGGIRRCGSRRKGSRTRRAYRPLGPCSCGGGGCTGRRRRRMMPGRGRFSWGLCLERGMHSHGCIPRAFCSMLLAFFVFNFFLFWKLLFHFSLKPKKSTCSHVQRARL